MPPLRNHHRRDPLNNECWLFFISLMSFFKKAKREIWKVWIVIGIAICPKKYLIWRPFSLLLLCHVLMSILSIEGNARNAKESCTNNVNWTTAWLSHPINCSSFGSVSLHFLISGTSSISLDRKITLVASEVNIKLPYFVYKINSNHMYGKNNWGKAFHGFISEIHTQSITIDFPPKKKLFHLKSHKAINVK